MSLLFVLVGFAFLLPFPSLFTGMGTIYYYLAGIAVGLAALAALGMRFRVVRGLARFIASVSLVFASFFLLRMWGQNYETRSFNRLHAVAPRACQEAAVDGASDEDALRRGLELAGSSPEDRYFLYLSCERDGAETSFTDGFDLYGTLKSDAGVLP
ncbi:hypothetical protein OV208_24920 [Corallococcus sp. bb12-1]|uniref:hypothetical protein n=1 Tax=Corallococcus sp. bb12-1 TaxID=2996784 RepID=UPI002270B2B1|nr:hypothetical protein [Corallococcus sp. bb12-1]MCY1044583.1 hypothetical protein [Corallococcus sp. bb12-1]